MLEYDDHSKVSPFDRGYHRGYLMGRMEGRAEITFDIMLNEGERKLENFSGILYDRLRLEIREVAENYKDVPEKKLKDYIIRETECLPDIGVYSHAEKILNKICLSE